MERSRARDVLSLLMQRLESAGAAGLRFGEPEPVIALEDGAECGLRIEIETAPTYERASDVRTLLARCLGSATFADVDALRVVPVAAARRNVVTLGLVVFDPQRTLRSNAAQAALDRSPPAEWWSAASDAARAAVEEWLRANPDYRNAIERRYLVSRVAYGGDEDEWKKWLEQLPQETHLAIEDVRNLRELKRSHESAFALVDEWLHERRANTGKSFQRSVWIQLRGEGNAAYVNSVGANDIEEVGGTPADSSAPDLEALASRALDETLEESLRMNAVRELATHGLDGLSLAARALSCEPIRLNVLAYVSWPEMQPLFREIVLSQDGQRVDAALACMRGWKRAFHDPRRAWEIAKGMPGNASMGFLVQGSILRDYARTEDRGVIPALLEGIDDGSRTEEWRRTAIQPLEKLEATEAADLLLRVALEEAGDGDGELDRAGFAAETMSYFARVTYPPAKKLLVRGLKTDSLCSAFATTALRRLGADGIPPLVAEAERLARTTFEGDHGWADSTAQALVREFGEIRKETGTLPVAEATLRGLVTLVPDLLDAVESLLHPQQAPPLDADESAVSGETPEKTYELRRARWLKPGYATRQYQRSGHRGAWDALVLSAHERYNRTEEPGKDPTLRGEYAKALEMGCRDGIVAYRDAVVRILAGEVVEPQRFRNAAEWMPSQYPHSPYRSSAWVKVAQAARQAGRTGEALDAARRAVDGIAHDPDARRILEELETSAAAAESAGSLPPLELGTLVAAPSAWHDAEVTSLHVAPDGAKVLSADRSGFVQVSHAIPADHFPRLIPDVREKLHDAATYVRWISATSFVSVSAGGAVCVVEWRPGEPFSVRPLPRGEEARAFSARVPQTNPYELVDPDGNWRAMLTTYGGIDVAGLRGGRGTSASGGSLGRYVLFDACFPHRMIGVATEHRKLSLITWGNTG